MAPTPEATELKPLATFLVPLVTSLTAETASDEAREMLSLAEIASTLACCLCFCERLVVVSLRPLSAALILPCLSDC